MSEANEISSKSYMFSLCLRPNVPQTPFCRQQKVMMNKFAQLTFTCSKSTIGTLEKGVKYVQS